MYGKYEFPHTVHTKPAWVSIRMNHSLWENIVSCSNPRLAPTLRQNALIPFSSLLPQLGPPTTSPWKWENNLQTPLINHDRDKSVLSTRERERET